MSNDRSPRALCSTTIGTRGMGASALGLTTAWLSYDHSNRLVVKEAAMRTWDETEPGAGEDEAARVRREVEIEASPEEVWDALATEEGRRRWLDDAHDREVHVESAQEPSRLVWWWWR